MNWRIEFYTTRRGDSPPREFLLSLPAKARAKITRGLDLLEEFGPAIGEPYVKGLSGHRGLYELRVRQGSDAFRLFFFQAGDHHLVVLNAIRKKTDKTPQRDLDTAEERRTEYLRRK